MPEDQRDIATELVHRGYAELLPDGRFCTARDFIVRSASAPLPPMVAAWLARAQGGSPLDATRPADAGTISAARTELTRPGT